LDSGVTQELDESELIAIFTADAERQGLRVQRVEASDRLLLAVTRSGSAVTGVERHQVTVDYYGTDAFLVDFDGMWTHVAFAYERDNRIEVAGDLVAAVSAYLRGDGVEPETSRLWRKPKRELLLTIDGGTLVLQREERGSAGPTA